MAYNKIDFFGNVLIDLTGDTVDAASLLSGKTAHGADGEIVTGAMPERGAVTGTIATKTGEYTIPAGHHNGSGKVGISGVEQAKIIAGNIKSGVTVLGVTGTYTGEGAVTQEKSVVPSSVAQSVVPDSGKLLSKVTVAAVPYAEEPLAGGTCVTIG